LFTSFVGYSIISSRPLFHFCEVANSWYNTWNIRLCFPLQVSWFLDDFLNTLLYYKIYHYALIIVAFGCSGFWSSVKVFLYHIPVVGWVIRFIARKFLLYSFSQPPPPPSCPLPLFVCLSVSIHLYVCMCMYWKKYR